MAHIELKEWLEGIRAHPQASSDQVDHANEGLKALDHLDGAEFELESIENALTQIDAASADCDLVRDVEMLCSRYGPVRDEFTSREDFDLGDDDGVKLFHKWMADHDNVERFAWRCKGVLAAYLGVDVSGKSEDWLITMLQVSLP